MKNQSNEKIIRLLWEEENKWYQRSKAVFILERDNNTRYFLIIVNGWQRKKRIFSLQQDDVRIEDQAELKHYITKYNKSLFRVPNEGNLTLMTPEQMIFHKSGKKRTISSRHIFLWREGDSYVILNRTQQSSRPWWLSCRILSELLGYQQDWSTKLVQFLHAGQLDLSWLNFDELVLLPKIKQRIQQYRPICILNVSFQIFTKVATNSPNTVVDHVVRPSQTVFTQRRNMLDGVLIPHETMHEMHRKTWVQWYSRLTFKWLFLQQTWEWKASSRNDASWFKI